MLSFFPLDVLDEIWDLIESVSEISYLLSVFGNGPTQSIMILLKGSSNAGIGCNPALGMTWLGVPTT